MSKKIETIEVDATEVVRADQPKLYDQIVTWIDAKEWAYEGSEKDGRLSFGLRLKDAAVRVYCWIYDNPEWKRVTVFTVYYTRVPEHRRAEVAMALARINYSTTVGCMEMDFDDGEIRTRTWHESEFVMTEEMLDRVIRRSVDLADQYQAPLLAIAFGNAAASTVIEMGARPDPAQLQ